MRMRLLASHPPWNWPADAEDQIREVLRDSTELVSERILAAELARDLMTMDDSLAEELLRILGTQGEPMELRTQTALALGSAIQGVVLDPDPVPGEPRLSEAMLRRGRKALRRAYQDPAVPREVRQTALAASARSPEAWHPGAIRAAYHDGDPEWKLTALYCMRFVKGFDQEIVEALNTGNPEILYQAVSAARDHRVDEAWPALQQMVVAAASGPGMFSGDDEAERSLVLAAMSAVVSIRPEESTDLLNGVLQSADEELAEAAEELLEAVSDLVKREG